MDDLPSAIFKQGVDRYPAGQKVEDRLACLADAEQVPPNRHPAISRSKTREKPVGIRRRRQSYHRSPSLAVDSVIRALWAPPQIIKRTPRRACSFHFRKPRSEKPP